MVPQFSKPLGRSRKLSRLDSMSFGYLKRAPRVFKIVGETARADAFIARDVKVLASECAIDEMDSGVGAVHPCAAEPATSQSDGSIALPAPRMAIFAPDYQSNCGRTLPFPVPQK